MEDRHRRPTSIGSERVVHDQSGQLIGFIGESSEPKDGCSFYARSTLEDTGSDRGLAWFETSDAAQRYLLDLAAKHG